MKFATKQKLLWNAVTCHGKLGRHGPLLSGVLMSLEVRAPQAHLSSFVMATKKKVSVFQMDVVSTVALARSLI